MTSPDSINAQCFQTPLSPSDLSERRRRLKFRLETHLIEQAKNGFESDADEDNEEQGSKNSEEDQSPEITVKEAARMVAELKRFGFKNNLKPEIVDALLNVKRD